MNRWRGRGHRFVTEDIGGMTVWKGYAGGVNWATWFDYFWQAKGAPSYVASLTDLVSSQVLIEGNGAVPWASGSGWGFIAAQFKYFDTGLIPTLDQTWSMLIQYAGMVWINAACLAALYDSVGHNGGFAVQTVNPNLMRTYNGAGGANRADNAGQLLAGNYGFAARQPYRDAVAEGTLIPVGAGTTDLNLYIGCNNVNGAALQHCTANIYAIGIATSPLAGPQVAAAMAAMAAL